MNRLSTPIFMDNVACFGSEEKLIDCSYDTDTSEDDHSADIRVHCAQNSETSTADAALTDDRTAMQDSTKSLSVAALTVSLIVFVLVIISGIVYIAYRHNANCILKFRKRPPSTER